ncbi:MAG TPA: zinc-ribbon domain-containing protein [Polyangiaceae bacterium]
MKVTCESCGSKYTIKDDKVRGKRVKIRCKGCKSPIVVDGLSIDGSSASSDSENAPAYSDVPDAPDDTGLASAQAAFPGAAPLGAAVERWSVNLSETDSRDMTTDEIVAAWRSGVVTDDAYIYKPGFDDWKPILEVPELARLVTASAAPDTFSPPVGKSPFAAKSAAPRAAASGRRGDLFGGVAAAGGEDDTGIAAPPMVIPSGDGKATGARNESSVLFSLDALKAGFAGPAPAPAAAAATRHDDPFGLSAAPSLSLGGGFDQNAALFAPPPPEPKKPKKISLAPSGAPGAPAPAAGLDRSKLIMIAAGVLVLLLAVGGVGFALGGSSSDKDESGEQAGLEKEEPAKAREGSSKADEKQAKADEKDAAEDKQAEAAAEKKEEKAEEEKPAEETAKADAEKAPDAAAATATKSTTASATGTKAEATATKTPKPDAPKADANAAPFNKSAAISALSSAAANAAGCKVPGGPTGSGKAIVTFAPSGRVTSANVSGGKFGGTSVGGCVASRFRGARVPPFSGSAVTVSKSFNVP